MSRSSNTTPTLGPPADCVDDYGIQQDTLGTVSVQLADKTPIRAGISHSRRETGRFCQAERKYQAVEIEANKNFSHNFLLRANYRYAKLKGNYEGLFRNDNGQSDPGISSLFDFTPGSSACLVTVRRRLLSILTAVTWAISTVPTICPAASPKGSLSALASGQSGIPINQLGSHPVYQNTRRNPDRRPWIGGYGAVEPPT